MTIYDRLVGSIPINKTAGVVVGLGADDFEPMAAEKRLKDIGVEIAQINKCLSSIKNNNFIGTKERNEIIKRKNELEQEAKGLKSPDGAIGCLAFHKVFFKLCKQKLPEKTFNELFSTTNDIIKYARDYLIREE